MKKYSKLETTGVWSSNDIPNSKEVNISFASISVNIVDSNNEPISQWAYGSVRLVKMNNESAVFSPDLEETEHLTIFDKDAAKYLLSLSEKKVNNSTKRILKYVLLIFIVSIGSLLIYKHHRISLEKLALTITSQEQENFIGSLVITNLKGLSLCDSDSNNSFVNTLIAKNMKINDPIINVKFFSSFRKHSLLLPGGTLLIPKNIINGKNGLINFERLILNSHKSQEELRPIKLFFSNQETIDLAYYILGYFEFLNFSNHLIFESENLNIKLEKRLNINDEQWMKIRGLCL